MPWREMNTMTLRHEFVMLAQREESNISLLCEYFGISRKSGYKWLNRFGENGVAGLSNRSRRPHSSPFKSPEAIETAIVALRGDHPAWGGRKIKSRLEKLGHHNVPAASTITGILRRRGLIDLEESGKHTAFVRFEHPYPNALWQMDFKGHFAMQQGRCHPLTVIDDHSRFNLTLKACANEKTETVQAALVNTFHCYGLPDRMTMDNGSPWGSDQFHELTPLTAWLIRLGIGVSHSRPYHPQTQGKDERFHRTLNVEAIMGQQFHDLAQCQRRFDEFRDCYNLERPHESLGMEAPVTRYQVSQRPYPEVLPYIEYGPDDHVRKVQAQGEISFQGKEFRVSKALRGYPVALRPTNNDGKYSLFFCHQKLKEIDLKTVTHVPEHL
ncbi:MAG TPA: IS481 family transposase [Geobacteraceae bacterium]